MSTPQSLLNHLRQQPWMVCNELPPYLRIPAHPGTRPHDVVRPLVDATIDDLAFAIQGLEDELNSLCSRINGLRRLHEQARRRGALGTDTIAATFTALGSTEVRQ